MAGSRLFTCLRLTGYLAGFYALWITAQLAHIVNRVPVVRSPRGLIQSPAPLQKPPPPKYTEYFPSPDPSNHAGVGEISLSSDDLKQIALVKILKKSKRHQRPVVAATLVPRQADRFVRGFARVPSRSCPLDTHTLVLVNSLPASHNQRDVIRRTWGSVAQGQLWPIRREPIESKFFIIFVMGQSRDSMWDELVRLENEEHGDILQGSFANFELDSPLVTLLGIAWANRECKHVKFALRCSDHQFINLPVLASILANYAPKNVFISPQKCAPVSDKDNNITTANAQNIYVISSDLFVPIDGMSQQIEVKRDLPDVVLMRRVTSAAYGQCLHHQAFQGTSDVTDFCGVILNRILFISKMKSTDMEVFWTRLHQHSDECRQ